MPFLFPLPFHDDFIINKFLWKKVGWLEKMVSKRVRLTLIKSILSSLPIYFMSCPKSDVGDKEIRDVTCQI